MYNTYIGQIMLVAWSFIPKGYAACNGQLLSIAQNSALFSLLGTTYGGDGVTTFALPDLRGRVPNGQGGNFVQGEAAGTETRTLLNVEMPSHGHAIAASNATGGADPTGSYPGAEGTSLPPAGMYASLPNAVMNFQSVGVTGGSQPFSNRQPYLTMNFVIATQGVFPSRS